MTCATRVSYVFRVDSYHGRLTGHLYGELCVPFMKGLNLRKQPAGS